MGKSLMSNKEWFIKSCEKSKSIREAILNIGYERPTNYYTLFKIWANKHEYDIEWLKNISKVEKNQKRGYLKYSKEDILGGNYKKIPGNVIKNRLYKWGIKKPICEICGINNIWNGFEIPMILDHINGKNEDNKIENLRIICHNCDATLPTYKGRNRKDKKGC